MSSEGEWIHLPENLENQPNKVRMHEDSILLRYSDDDMTMRVDNADASDLEELKSYLDNSDDARLIMKLLSMVEKAEKVTQVGSRVTVDENVPERFDWNCPCCERDKFQLRGRYTGLHAVCVNCGERASTIIDYCDRCDQQSIFAKESANVDDWYECYYCGDEMES